MLIEEEKRLAALQEQVGAVLSEKRFLHTLGVRETAERMAALFCPAQRFALAAAALLHDFTKELPTSAHLEIFHRYGYTPRQDELASPQVLHGISASLLLPDRFAAFATPTVIRAVRYHTTGCAGMSMPCAILYLADCLEPTRTQPALIAQRAAFFTEELETMGDSARKVHLQNALIRSLRETVAMLLAKGLPICAETQEALTWLENEKNPF